MPARRMPGLNNNGRGVNLHLDGNSYGFADSDINSYGFADANVDCHRFADANVYGYGYGFAVADVNSHVFADGHDFDDERVLGYYRDPA